jgi:cytochrome oxidase Cu insertion factor (SCO1/SenC/PrrC family)
VPDAAFVDQDGRKRRVDAFHGRTVLLTFIYTRCPFPTFCPLMDQHFKEIQDAMKKDAVLKGRVHLISVSFDPTNDTPPVLKEHARKLMADPNVWTFLTGTVDNVDKFGARFGLSVVRSSTDARDITHTLRTAIIDRNGRLAKVYTGNEWTPMQALADLESVAAANCRQLDRSIAADGSRATAYRAAPHAVCGPAVPQRSAVQQRAGRASDASQLPRRRAARLRALPRSRAGRRDAARGPRVSTARLELRID